MSDSVSAGFNIFAIELHGNVKKERKKKLKARKFEKKSKLNKHLGYDLIEIARFSLVAFSLATYLHRSATLASTCGYFQ